MSPWWTMTCFLSCFISLCCRQYSVISQVINQPFFDLHDEHFTACPYGIDGNIWNHMQDRWEELVRWKVPCLIQKQVGRNYTLDILISDAMRISQFISVVGLIQSFPTCSLHNRKWSFIELSCVVSSPQGIALAPVALTFGNIALLRRLLEGNLDHIDTRAYFN